MELHLGYITDEACMTSDKGSNNPLWLLIFDPQRSYSHAIWEHVASGDANSYAHFFRLEALHRYLEIKGIDTHQHRPAAETKRFLA